MCDSGDTKCLIHETVILVPYDMFQLLKKKKVMESEKLANNMVTSLSAIEI